MEYETKSEAARRQITTMDLLHDLNRGHVPAERHDEYRVLVQNLVAYQLRLRQVTGLHGEYREAFRQIVRECKKDKPDVLRIFALAHRWIASREAQERAGSK